MGIPGKGAVAAMILSFCVVAAAVAVYRWDLRNPKGPLPQVHLRMARGFYASQPIYLRPFPYSPVPRGLPNLEAKTCGACHQAIYREWQVSTHARAWLDDVQFQEELAKSKKGGKDVAWMCVNCHTPLENQLERLVIGLRGGMWDQPLTVANPNFRPGLQLEAITCAVCHVRDGVVLGPWGNTRAPHPVKKSPALLRSETCTRCHQAVATFASISLACTFNTGKELAAGPYAKQGHQCQTCHMPEVMRPLTNLKTPPRKTRMHYFGGSLIPKKPEYEAALKPVRKLFPDGMAIRWVRLPKSVAPGRPVTLVFEVENANAGHLLPTGDPERFIRVEVTVRDAARRLVAQRRVRFGTEYQWHPQVKKLSDNRLKPKEARRYRLTFSAPARGSLVLHVKASKWRISEKNMAYHKLEGRIVAGRTFVDRRQTLPIGAGKL